MAGLREWKKQLTRQMISDVATKLILEKGFDNVGVREIARAAHVSPTTLFAYFPSKEAMFIDRDEELADELLSAVRERPYGTTALQAAQVVVESWTREPDDPRVRKFMDTIRDTPQLANHWRDLGTELQHRLAQVLAEAWDRPEDDPYAAVAAQLIVELRDPAVSSASAGARLSATFDLLERGLPFPSQ